MKSNFLGNLVSLWGRRGVRPHKLSPLVEALLSSRGEASGVALARQILDAYAGSSADERLAFFQLLAAEFGTDRLKVAQAIASYQADPGSAQAIALHTAAEPRRQEMIRRLNLAAGGTVDLVRMREE